MLACVGLRLFSPLAAGCWLLVTGCWLLAAGNWLLVAGFWKGWDAGTLESREARK
jgi:hypothetical protein